MSQTTGQSRSRPERRTLLRWLMGGFLSLWGLGAAGVGVSFLKSPHDEERPGASLVKGGELSSLPVGSARVLRHGSEPLFVLRTGESQVVALSAICTHMRCVLEWDSASKKIVCPCHDGAFDRNGNVLSGPATKPLRRYSAEIRAGEIIVRAEGSV